MDDLISRNSVEHLVMTKSYDLGEPIQKRLMMHDVEQLPPAQSEIIYCGECAHMEPNGKCKAFADPKIRPSASDFCSAGEMRDNE